ncbi:MAG: hypothetical protein OK422_05650 [Thaumarchaeota archaeon]|nr:hypothetical protein [Nitrososphaerota archaeon]
MPSKIVPLAAVLVVGLVVGYGASYAVYSGQVSSLQNSLNQANASNAMLHSEVANATTSLAFQPQAGQMFHTGWLFIAPTSPGDYAISVHAEGLEPPSAGGYIVEGVTRPGMNMVPIGPNATASEFDASSGGVGTYWVVLMQNPHTSFEAVDILYLPGMQMTNAVLVASVQLG